MNATLEQKKILFTSHTANFSKFNKPFMKMLKDRGWTVHYASDGEEDVPECHKSFSVPFRRNPIKLDNVRAYHQLKKIINSGEYDIIHTHTPVGSVITRLAAREARKKGTKVIYTAHGFHFFRGAPLINWLTYYPIERHMAKHTDTLIAINDEDYQRAKKRFKTDVQYIPGVGVDGGRFKALSLEKRSEIRKSLNLNDSDFIMIFPAELNKNKNQTLLIESMRMMIPSNPNIHLLLPGKDSMNGFHKQLTERYRLQDNIHFLGYRNDIPDLVKISDLALSASYREGLPVNLMEASAAGIPAVATNCRGNRDVIIDGVNGYLVDINDMSTMSEEILKIKNLDSKSKDELRKSCIDTSNRYLLDTIIVAYKNIYLNRIEDYERP